jgi:hypothetical protein
LCAPLALATGPQWVLFDPKMPQDFIDVTSITSPSADIVRFWERGGVRPARGSAEGYPQYTLSEINCKQRTHRELQWDAALEDQDTPAGMAARAKFLKSLGDVAGTQEDPTWESIEPNEHSCARLDFVCHFGEKAK